MTPVLVEGQVFFIAVQVSGWNDQPGYFSFISEEEQK